MPIRIVLAAAPQDSPYRDLHIWDTGRLPFADWWKRREEPHWVGVRLGHANLPDVIRQCLTYPEVHFQIYTAFKNGIPCGCSPSGIQCPYHAHGNVEIAECGCSAVHGLTCEFHSVPLTS